MAAAFGLMLPAIPAMAEEPKYELKNAGVTIKDVLQENLGKRVIVRLETGENLEGTVLKVGDTVLHLAKISGRDFYDAVVRRASFNTHAVDWYLATLPLLGLTLRWDFARPPPMASPSPIPAARCCGSTGLSVN